MEYAFMFSVMGTWILWLQYRNYKLMKGMRILAMLLDKAIAKEIEVSRDDSGYQIKFKRNGE